MTTATRATVVFRLAGPMQAWPTGPNRAITATGDHPTRAGMIGFIANALGRDYADPIDDLVAASWAVRADRPGSLATDFHTAGAGVMPLLPGNALDGRLRKIIARTPEGEIPTLKDGQYAAPRGVKPGSDGTLTGSDGNPALLVDHYLADAVFTAAVTCPTDLADQIAAALTAPARILFLGRRAYPTTGTLLVTTTDHTAPVDALKQTPADPDATPGPWTVWTDTPIDRSRHVLVNDQPDGPISARRWRTRLEWSTTIEPPTPIPSDSDTTDTDATDVDTTIANLDFFNEPEDHTR